MCGVLVCCVVKKLLKNSIKMNCDCLQCTYLVECGGTHDNKIDVHACTCAICVPRMSNDIVYIGQNDFEKGARCDCPECIPNGGYVGYNDTENTSSLDCDCSECIMAAGLIGGKAAGVVDCDCALCVGVGGTEERGDASPSADCSCHECKVGSMESQYEVPAGGGFRVKVQENVTKVSNIVERPEVGNHVFSDLEKFYLNAHARVKNSGVYNYMGARIPVPNHLNIQAWKDNLVEYEDNSLIDMLEFGFPIGYEKKEDPVSVLKNHKGATEFPDSINQYLSKEMENGLVLGPWSKNYFGSDMFVSPLNSVPKKNEGERRIISDLSFPEGLSVNDGIDKDQYLGQQVNLCYPTVDNLATILKEKGPGTHIFKKDLKKAYRQFKLDPGDINYCVYFWEDRLFVDLALVMGCRSAAHICQRITDSVSFIAKNRGVITLNYLDDICGVADPGCSDRDYDILTELLSELGLVESEEKSTQPGTRVEFLGVMFDSEKQTMEITENRLVEIRELLEEWLLKKRASKRDLQSLIGKLVFVSKCIFGSRVFLARLLASLRQLKKQNHRFKIGSQFRKDLIWWKEFLVVYNGISYIPEMIWREPDADMSTDACLVGGGGWSGDELFSFKFPDDILGKGFHINILELWTVLVGLRIWKSRFTGKRIQIICDNEVSVGLINTGRGRDPMLLKILREILYLCCVENFQIRAVHIPGVENRRADKLSRMAGNIPDLNGFGKNFSRREILVSDFVLKENW